MQRLRIKFTRGEEVKFISHLDMTRLWQRALLRADIPLAYSQGFNPHPQIAMASPLQVSVTSSAELMDIILYRQMAPQYFLSLIKKQLPEGIEILEVRTVALPLPSLQSDVSFAGYEIAVETENTRDEVEDAIDRLMLREELPWQHERDTGMRRYDLRALIDRIWLIDYANGLATIGMKLRCDSSGAGRPEQVSLALGFKERPRLIHRTELTLKSQTRSLTGKPITKF